MFPYLRVFGKTIPMYGICAVTGVLSAVVYLKLNARKEKELEADIELAFVYSLLGAAIGAKLLYLFTVLSEFLHDLPFVVSATDAFLNTYIYAGFVFYGGMIGSYCALWLYCRICHISFPVMAERMLPTFPLIHAFGRIGCFCMGCCFGRPTDSGLGIAFHISEYAPNHVPLVPIQLIEASVEFLLFGLAAKYSRSLGGRVSLGLYTLIYGAARFLLEFYRGDGYRGFIGPFSLSQLISVAAVVFGILLIRKRSPSPAGNSE